MTPMQAIMAGTSWAAECCGIEKEVGILEKGKFADLLVLDGDPLRDITLLQDKSRIKLVMKEGKIYADALTTEPTARA